MYKLSKYNYLLTNFPEAAILFNGVTKKFFLIKREKLAQYVNLPKIRKQSQWQSQLQ